MGDVGIARGMELNRIFKKNGKQSRKRNGREGSSALAAWNGVWWLNRSMITVHMLKERKPHLDFSF